MRDPFEEYKPLSLSEYPSSLPHDLACCVTPEEVDALRLKYSYDAESFEYILNRHDFKREYSEWCQRLISEGNSFKLKLRAMAEDFLPHLSSIINADTTAPSVKIDAFKYMTKVAELEPVKQDENKSSGARITIEIANYAAQPAHQTIDITP